MRLFYTRIVINIMCYARIIIIIIILYNMLVYTHL